MATGAASRDLIETLPLYRRAAELHRRGDDLPAGQPPARGAAASHEHIKPRLLGHWGTVPGLNLMYAGLNRLILDTGASILLVTGPGHGAPANLANLWIDGCLEDVDPELSRDRDGLGQAGPQLLLAGRLPEPPRADRARDDPRGRRARLRARHGLRRGARQPGPDRRRASSATARPRPARPPAPGTRTSSSTPRPPARCCRSCTSTATRSPTRRSTSR